VAYFQRLGESTFRATTHVGGAWDPARQHISPALGLLAHVVEQDRDCRRGDGLVIGRLSYDILGTIPVDIVDTAVSVIRPGRTVELVEATLRHAERDAVRLRAWLMRSSDTARLEGTSLPRIAFPEDMPIWQPSTVWPGGFIASAEVRRAQAEPGRASFWVRSSLPLIEGEEVSQFARAAGLLDIANGITVRVSPAEVGFDTTVSFGPDGLGVTSSVLHDVRGPIGTMSQMLTVRPSPPGNGSPA
jgi:hypothetical protein